MMIDILQFVDPFEYPLRIDDLKETLIKVSATGSAYREAVTSFSPGLARFAATLGKESRTMPTPTGLRPGFCIAVSPVMVNSCRGHHFSLPKETVATPLGLW